MELQERETFSKMLLSVGQLYSKTISPMVVKLYWEALVSHPLSDVMRAVECHIQDTDCGQFMPKPSDLIRIIKGDTQSQALLAWSKVEKAIRQVGPYRSVAFDDPIIHVVVVEMGGWIKLCQGNEKELPFTRKEFQTRYASYRYNSPKSYPRYFVGIQEHQNQLQGFKVEEVILIGDQNRAESMLAYQTRDAILHIEDITADAIA